MEEISNEQKKAVAVANLSQLQYFVETGDLSARVKLPDAGIGWVQCKKSFVVLGVKIDDKCDENVHYATISAENVQKLIDAGVSTPTLDAVRGETPAVKKFLNR